MIVEIKIKKEEIKTGDNLLVSSGWCFLWCKS